MFRALKDRYGPEFNWETTAPMDFCDEIQRELDAGHPLYEQIDRSVARCLASDDVLFLLKDGCYAIVHLTYSKDNAPGYPFYQCFRNLDAALQAIEMRFAAEYC